MFSGGELASGPASSGKGSVACKASDGLLVDAVAALKAIMKPCKRKGRRLCGEECAVHVQCGVLDKEEMLGYLLADAFGLPLLRPPVGEVNEARSVGETARLRATKAAPAIDAARRQGKAAELEALRSRVVAELPLVKRPIERTKPRPLPTLAPPPPQPPPPPESDPRLVRWCSNQGGTNGDPADIVKISSRWRYERQKRERAWNPTSQSEQDELASTLARRDAYDDICTCAQGTPSFLCPVNICFATAAGSRCEARRQPLHDCDCMGWLYEGPMGKDQNSCPDRITPPLDPDRHLIDPYRLRDMMQWQPPVPVGGWPAFDSGPEERAAKRAEQERRLRQKAKQKAKLTERERAAKLRAWVAEAGRRLGLKE
jgi:hypothetical protein